MLSIGRRSYFPPVTITKSFICPRILYGWRTKNVQKLRNVADPNELVDKYGTDALRYYLLKEISPFADGDFAEKKLVEVYNSDLANG